MSHQGAVSPSASGPGSETMVGAMHAAGRPLGALLAGLLALAPSLPAVADTPARVVSMNLCTDLLAMELAAPGQLVSVSHIARDPLVSPLAEAAAQYPGNRGGAEEIFLMQPDLVLAGVWTDPVAVGMLRRLGIEVVQVDVVTELDEVADRVRQVGALLGQSARAEAVARDYLARLATLREAAAAIPAEDRRVAEFYYPNGYSLGVNTMSHEILRAAGFAHLAEAEGRAYSGTLPLEKLVLSGPDLVIRSETYAGASRSEEVLGHPALVALAAGPHGYRSTADWICGVPQVLTAVDDLAGHRARMEAAE